MRLGRIKPALIQGKAGSPQVNLFDNRMSISAMELQSCSPFFIQRQDRYGSKG
jgi:hypothetical protein